MRSINRTFKAVAVSALTLTALCGGVAAQTGEAPPKQPPQTPAQPPITKPSLAIGKAAPAFELRDLDGQTHGLSQHRGRVVVLEWLDPACAEVRYQHTAGAMRSLARQFEKDEITWLAVYAMPAEKAGGVRETLVKARKELNLKYPIVLDENGVVTGRYTVTTSPTVFVIDQKGILRYCGAIDNAPAGDLPEGVHLREYLKEALQSVLHGSELATTRTEAHGCPVLPNPKG